MMKLKRYLKPYIGFALAAIVLMFCQAAVDLNLPNLMSDIVNVGIQQGGITEAAPKAVSAEGLQLMSAFMSEEDRALAQSQYVLAEQANMTADEWDRFVTDWPKVSDTDVYRQIPNLDDSTQAQLDSAFSRASYALMTVVKDLAEQSGQDIAAGDTDSKAMDMSKLGELVPMLAMLPQGMVDDAIAAAAATPESMLSQTAAVFTKGFYMQLGADTDAMQTSYIFRTGGKMLLMALLLAVCAISVGFCGSRMGAGIVEVGQSVVQHNGGGVFIRQHQVADGKADCQIKLVHCSGGEQRGVAVEPICGSFCRQVQAPVQRDTPIAVCGHGPEDFRGPAAQSRGKAVLQCGIRLV